MKVMSFKLYVVVLYCTTTVVGSSSMYRYDVPVRYESISSTRRMRRNIITGILPVNN